MNNWFKQNGIHLGIIAIFIGICIFYFTPAFNGKSLGQSDVIGAQSTQKEINDYKEKGTTILWTNQIFGGMPAFQIWAPYPNNITTWIVKGVSNSFPNPVNAALLMMLGSYLLFNVLRLKPWLAAAGAIAFAFSSYHIILLQAGHANQVLAIAFFAPILAGIILTLRGKYLLGASLTAFFLAMEIRVNHIQMTYYLMIALIIFICIELYHAFKGKTLAAFGKAMAYLSASLLLALLVNASSLWSTYEYGKESYRGKSNLTKNTKEPTDGLDKNYAYDYSQGVAECFTFLVPNAYGGPSGLQALDIPASKVNKYLLDRGVPEEQSVGFVQQLGQYGLQTYWGNKPGTSGPVYLGAVVCFLFVFGLIIVRSRMKWWIAGTVVLIMFLSFGKNLPFLSDLFFHYFPLYNKFRTVDSILAIACLLVPILALLAVQEAIENPDKKYVFKQLKLAGYITGGIALILIVYPELFLNFRGDSFQQLTGTLSEIFKQVPTFAQQSAEMASGLASALVSDRAALARADAIRALIFIAITFGMIWAFIEARINLTVFSVVLLALVLIDLWQIDKRYLNEGSFQDKLTADEVFKPREVDNFIARDTDPNFRVFDATQPIKSDMLSPFFHKSIGGYSAARLKRYEELMDNQLLQGNQNVLDMLNAKYIISPDEKNGTANMRANNTACGHAWFVNKVLYVDNADQEMEAISSFTPRIEAMVDKQYKPLIGDNNFGGDPNATIALESYNPDHLVYKSGSTTEQVAVFSEIFYDKGWTMKIDGKEAPYFRVNYLLRAAKIPVGNHTIQFDFHPTSYYAGEKVSLAGSILLVLALGGAAYTGIKRKEKVAKV
ncbi:YfhO family protein [Mucilaginibacter myungsuensis]|uniref:YfhO family protein n=1 Tax=Mucilaginibacter myungsuensis TaxID=649104 RepID=A0A929PYX3_9SPHI|nr:YfhO family protein [Mucilaginibacter myungsuensis]MBE9663787.1 YfhO family protein [Mucilaginibacter myungsuensis]MDN3598498.1 YfhO family protein [Mucilaginibacter myungsuensis]